MNGPGIRPGRMVLLTSGIVDERPPCPRSALSTVRAADVEPATDPATGVLAHCWVLRDQVLLMSFPPTVGARRGHASSSGRRACTLNPS